MTEAVNRGSRERLHDIDLLRFAAAAGVALYHFTFFGPASGLMPMAATALDGVTRYGGLGVNLFFIISGFVILMSAQHSTPRQFVVARAVRLYPAYWICCTATYLGLLVLPHPAFSVSFGQYLANLTMVSPLAGIDYLDGVYWSLLVELHFYLLVFLLLLTGLLAHTRALLGGWLAIALLDHYDIVATYATNQLFFTAWSGYFIAGAMFYLVRQRRRWDAYAVAVLCGSCLMVIQKALAVSAVETRDLGAGMDPTILTVVLVGFFVLFAVIASDRTAALRSPRLALLGGLTYPLYLLHQRLGYAVITALGPRLRPGLLVPLVIAGVIAASYTVHWHLERPLGRRLRTLVVPAVVPVTAALATGPQAGRARHEPPA